jgi:hypothetical protein
VVCQEEFPPLRKGAKSRMPLVSCDCRIEGNADGHSDSLVLLYTGDAGYINREVIGNGMKRTTAEKSRKMKKRMNLKGLDYNKVRSSVVSSGAGGDVGHHDTARSTSPNKFATIILKTLNRFVTVYYSFPPRVNYSFL